MTEYVVDGMNVIGSRPDGWWRDRAAARRRLVGALTELARAGDVLTVFFDGRPSPAETAADPVPGVTVRFAPGGRNAADDAIAAHVAALAQPAVVVVTSDADLARRVRDSGASVLGSGTFRDRFEVR